MSKSRIVAKPSKSSAQARAVMPVKQAFLPHPGQAAPSGAGLRVKVIKPKSPTGRSKVKHRASAGGTAFSVATAENIQALLTDNIRLRRQVSRIEQSMQELLRLVADALVQGGRAQHDALLIPAGREVPGQSPERAEAALALAFARLGAPTAEDHALAAQLDQPAPDSTAAVVEWVRVGDLVPTQQLLDVWGGTRQGWEQACQRGELFAFLLRRRRYYPKVFLSLNSEQVGGINLALDPLSSIEKFLFWRRAHGSLDGRTVEQALQNGEYPRVLRVATGFAQEQAEMARPGAARAATGTAATVRGFGA